MTRWLLAIGLILAAWTAFPLGAATLIGEDEAKRPSATPGITQRGVTRGPTMKMINPAATKAPFDFQVRFQAHGGAKIEPASLKVTYLKSPPLDITERVKPFASADGIAMPKAEAPPGEHPIRIEIKDSEGRAGTATFNLTVN